MGDWTVRVALRTQHGIILVRNKDGERWHLVGGKKDPHDIDWRCTAVREVLEEPGYIISREDPRYHEFSHNKNGKRGRYSLHYCALVIPDAWLTQLNETGPDDEDIRLFPYEEVRKMKDIGAYDREYLGRRKLLRPPKGVLERCE